MFVLSVPTGKLKLEPSSLSRFSEVAKDFSESSQLPLDREE